MVLSLIVVDFMNRDGLVHNMRLDGLLVDDRLDSLMNVMMHMLASDRSLGTRCALTLDVGLSVTILGTLSIELGLDISVRVVELPCLRCSFSVVVSFRPDLFVKDRLLGRVIVILMDLTIDRGHHLLMLGTLDVLILDRWCDGLMDSRVMMARLSEELLDGIFGGIHIVLLEAVD